MTNHNISRGTSRCERNGVDVTAEKNICSGVVSASSEVDERNAAVDARHGGDDAMLEGPAAGPALPRLICIIYRRQRDMRRRARCPRDLPGRSTPRRLIMSVFLRRCRADTASTVRPDRGGGAWTSRSGCFLH